MTRRLLASYLTLTLFVLLVLEIPLGLTFARREKDELASNLEHDAVILATFVEDSLEQRDPGPLTARVRQYAADTDARVVVVGTDGIAVLDTAAPSGEPRRTFATRPEIQRALAGEVATGTRHSDTLGTDLLFVAVPVASGGVVHGAVRITYPTSELDSRVRRNWLTLAGVALVSLLAAAGVGVAVARSVTGPLRRVERAAAALGMGAMGTRAEADAGPPEVRSLARAFNDMAGRIEELVASQDAFVADASHQLRSPLTALRLRLENIQAGGGGPDADAALSEVERLSRTVDALLALARADRATAQGPAAVIDVHPLLEERAQAWAPLAAERGVTVVVAPAFRAMEARATRERLEQVIDNLLANAVEVSPEGSTLTLATAAEDGAVEVHVVDDGPGMSEDERRHAFDRFWRGTSSPGGSGLGLAIAARLARADGGDIELRESRTGGVDAVVRLRPPPATP